MESRRTALLAEVSTLLHESQENLDVRAVSLWHFVSERLLENVARAKQSYQIQIEQQEHKIRFLRQLLGQYQKNWTGVLQNLVDAYFQQRMAGRTFAPFFDARQPGPEVQTFLSAAGLPALYTKVEQFVLDHMGDFAGALEGLATRMELHRITFGDMNVRWSPRAIGPRLEALLTEQHVFQTGSEKRGGIVAMVTGKSSAIVEQRKGQIAQACREIARGIVTDYSEWCTNFMTTFEHNIGVQLTAALANQGLPDVDRLRTAMEGFDRLVQRMREIEEASPSSEGVIADWLRQLSLRRWIPLYHRV
jgi:hypothetical protein